MIRWWKRRRARKIMDAWEADSRLYWAGFRAGKTWGFDGDPDRAFAQTQFPDGSAT